MQPLEPSINPSLIGSLDGPIGITIIGDDLFVTFNQWVSEYTTSGATVHDKLITSPGAEFAGI